MAVTAAADIVGMGGGVILDVVTPGGIVGRGVVGPV